MKKLILFLFLASSICLYSQKYVPFPTDSANWSVMLEYENINLGGPDSFKPVTALLQYSLQGDTIINSITYRKLCKNIGTVVAPVYTGIGGLREQDKKIYFVGEDYSSFQWSNTDVLLYDFNKQIGDTVMEDEYRINYVITGIDSIKIGREFRKRYEINNYDIDYNYKTEYIIEGIGNVNTGLLEATIHLPTDMNLELQFICFSQNGETVYLNPVFRDCNSTVMTGVKDIKSDRKTVKIYPSPAKDYIRFEFDYPDKKYTTAEIMDYTGKRLSTIPVAGISLYTLNLSSYTPGVYFILIRSTEGNEVHKIIKK